MSTQIGPNLWGLGVHVVRAVGVVLRKVGDWCTGALGGLIMPILLIIALFGFFAWLLPFVNASDRDYARTRHPIYVAKCEARGGHVVVFEDEQAQCLRDGDVLDEWWAPGEGTMTDPATMRAPRETLSDETGDTDPATYSRTDPR